MDKGIREVAGQVVQVTSQVMTPATLARIAEQDRRVAVAYCNCGDGCTCDADEPIDGIEALDALTFEERREIQRRFGTNPAIERPSVFSVKQPE